MLFRGLQDLHDRTCEAAPVRFFASQLFAALGGEFVELGLTAVFGFAPFGGEPAALFKAVKSRVERALLGSTQGLDCISASPVRISTGTETCECAMSHTPLIFFKQSVTRTVKFAFFPSFMVTTTWLI
jgi:hypothetical protein